MRFNCTRAMRALSRVPRACVMYHIATMMFLRKRRKRDRVSDNYDRIDRVTE